MSTVELPLDVNQPKAEFKDTPPSIQLIEFGICAVGAYSAWHLFSMMQNNPMYLWAAGAVVIAAGIAVFVVHTTYGNKTSLKHMHDGIVLDDRGNERKIPFDQLLGFSASWTDMYINGIYSTTNVKFTFDVAGAYKVYAYDSSSKKGTLKYEQLEALQSELTEAVSHRMKQALLADGTVDWTPQLTITTGGIDYRKKGKGEPQLIDFSRLGRWEVHEGVFKLALDDERRPSITEKVDQNNFFPGLVLFAELQQEFGNRENEPNMGEQSAPQEPVWVEAPA